MVAICRKLPLRCALSLSALSLPALLPPDTAMAATEDRTPTQTPVSHHAPRPTQSLHVAPGPRHAGTRAPARSPARTVPAARHRDHGPVQGGNEAVEVSSHRSVSRGADNVVSKAVMEQFTPGTSVLKAADRLPGVSFSSTDPLGIDLWGARAC